MTIATVPRVDAERLFQLLTGSEEFALLDVRELNDLSERGALLLATHLPIGRIATDARRLIPRITTPIVVTDDEGTDLSQRAGRLLSAAGYTDVSILDGGIRAWQASGRPIYYSSYIFALAFATYLEREDPTEHIGAEAVAELLASPEAPLLVDTRTTFEHTTRSIPDSVRADGTDIPRQVLAHTAGGNRGIVLTCAGYSRSIMGAQALKLIGTTPAPRVLEDGTKAWKLAGYEFDHGRDGSLALELDLPEHHAAATRLRTEYSIPVITEADVPLLLNQADRTTYTLDVRSTREYLHGHSEYAHSVPSETLLPWSVRIIGVLRSRIILFDTGSGLRATIAAVWLRKQGWDDVRIVVGDFTRTDPVPYGAVPPHTDVTPADGTAPTRRVGYRILDVGTHDEYMAGHLGESEWISWTDLPTITDAAHVIVAGSTPAQASYAAADLKSRGVSASYVTTDRDTWVSWDPKWENGVGRQLSAKRDAELDRWATPDWKRLFDEQIQWERTLHGQFDDDDTIPFRDGRV